MSGHRHVRWLVIGVVVTVALLSVPAWGAESSEIREVYPALEPVIPPAFTSAHPDDYTGWLRLYIVEPVSHYKDNNDNPFHFGFLDFAFDSAVVVPDGARQHRTMMWDASAAGFWSATDTNIMVIAVLFNSDPHQGYSDPPSGSPFTAYYTDAACGAVPGESDSNTTRPGWTHTVFVHEGSTSWCPNCPTTSFYLHGVYSGGNYNFYYATMVADLNGQAGSFMNSQYNLTYVPTCYADGGDDILIGGWSPHQPYANMIAACGARAVPDVGLLVTMDFLGGDEYQIDVVLTHGAPTNIPPGVPTQATGETAGLIDSSYEFSTSATDPNGEDLYYRWSWGDGSYSDWLGPYSSGATASASNDWTEEGSFNVTVQARDIWKHETIWSSPLLVTLTCCANRGNVDGLIGPGGAVDVADLTYLVAFLFGGGDAAPCEKQGNVDGIIGPGGQVDVADLTYLVAFLFGSGGPPPACD